MPDYIKSIFLCVCTWYYLPSGYFGSKMTFMVNPFYMEDSEAFACTSYYLERETKTACN